MDQLRRHGVAADVEVEQRALGLRPPVNVRRDLDLPMLSDSVRAFGFAGAAMSGSNDWL